jgi:hypothetical protein
VVNPAAAPAAAFSHDHASADAGEVPSGISGERWPLHLRLSLRGFDWGRDGKGRNGKGRRGRRQKLFGKSMPPRPPPALQVRGRTAKRALSR